MNINSDCENKITYFKEVNIKKLTIKINFKIKQYRLINFNLKLEEFDIKMDLDVN